MSVTTQQAEPRALPRTWTILTGLCSRGVPSPLDPHLRLRTCPPRWEAKNGRSGFCAGILFQGAFPASQPPVPEESVEVEVGSQLPMKLVNQSLFHTYEKHGNHRNLVESQPRVWPSQSNECFAIIICSGPIKLCRPFSARAAGAVIKCIYHSLILHPTDKAHCVC